MDSYLQRLSDAIHDATDGMTPQDLARHPEGKWSAAEVLEHLSLTYTGTAKGCERLLAAGTLPLTAPTLKQRLSTAVVVGAGYLPGGREAPKGTRPQGLPAESVLAGIKPNLAAMDEAIAKCEARYGKATKVLDHPVLGPLSPEQWRKFHWVHGKHHVKQILRLREAGRR